MKNNKIEEIRRWFLESVTYKGEAYAMDKEQVAAVIDESKNTIVVARAGSGKTRTIVAKIIYMVAKCGVKPDEIMVFVFNANAASEINERLNKMRVDGVNIINGVKVASTFHAFARRVVYSLCHGEEKSGKILAHEKEKFVFTIVAGMMKSKRWGEKIRTFITGGDETGEVCDEMLWYFVKMMSLFINRAQQKFLAGEYTLKRSLRGYYSREDVGERERLFAELGAECYRRYHWFILDEKARRRLGAGLASYGTDFNLIVSWASKLIGEGRAEVAQVLENKKYILIDEYQDFSQLFLSVVLAIRDMNPEVKLFVVGDDWQAINRFAGSEVEYFRRFEKYFTEGTRRYEITTNYRSDYAIVGAARKFMSRAMDEKGRFRASSRKAGKVMLVNPNDVKVDYIDLVVKLIRENRRKKDILILHRNNEMNKTGMSLEALAGILKARVVKEKVMSLEDFEEKVRIMTMHKSKGLEAEVVIILEADDGVIPKTHPDMKLYGLFGETEKTAFEDQVRLFYVAMTRAKKRLYIIYNPAHGEGFYKYFGSDFKRWEP